MLLLTCVILLCTVECIGLTKSCYCWRVLF